MTMLGPSTGWQSVAQFVKLAKKIPCVTLGTGSVEMFWADLAQAGQTSFGNQDENVLSTGADLARAGNYEGQSDCVKT